MKHTLAVDSNQKIVLVVSLVNQLVLHLVINVYQVVGIDACVFDHLRDLEGSRVSNIRSNTIFAHFWYLKPMLGQVFTPFTKLKGHGFDSVWVIELVSEREKFKHCFFNCLNLVDPKKFIRLESRMSNLEISFYLRKTNMCKIAFGAQYLRRNWEEAKLLNCYWCF